MVKTCIFYRSEDFSAFFVPESRYPSLFFNYIKARCSELKLTLIDNEITTAINKEYCIIRYSNNNFDRIPFFKILKQTKYFFSLSSVHISTSFKYNLLFSRSIFNYNLISRNLYELSPSSCICDSNSPFFNLDFKHIISGDINLVNNHNLQSLLQLGTKFRLNSYKDMEYYLFNDLDSFIYRRAIKYSHPIHVFEAWKSNFFVISETIIKLIPTDIIIFLCLILKKS